MLLVFPHQSDRGCDLGSSGASNNHLEFVVFVKDDGRTHGGHRPFSLIFLKAKTDIVKTLDGNALNFLLWGLNHTKQVENVTIITHEEQFQLNV